VTTLQVIALIVAIGLLAYLVFALLYPEKLS
jgi:K+-transporting ATPase KdpF subunit